MRCADVPDLQPRAYHDMHSKLHPLNCKVSRSMRLKLSVSPPASLPKEANSSDSSAVLGSRKDSRALAGDPLRVCSLKKPVAAAAERCINTISISQIL